MRLLRHGVASIVIFAVLVGLLVQVYDDGLVANYGITKGDIRGVGDCQDCLTDGNIVDQLKALDLIEGIGEITTAVADTQPGSSSLLDILGSIAAVGLGVLKSVFGLFAIPYQLANIIGAYYLGGNAGVIAGLGGLIVVYGGFILLSAYLKQEV